jgi:hypothetical protein
MTIGKLLTKNGQTLVARQSHGVGSMDTYFSPGHSRIASRIS